MKDSKFKSSEMSRRQGEDGVREISEVDHGSRGRPMYGWRDGWLEGGVCGEKICV